MVIATLGMAIATFLLAIAAFLGLIFTRKQINVLSNQLRIQRSQLVPYITVSEVRVEGDEIVVELNNNSDAAAYWLGMLAEFYIVYPRYYGSQKTKDELSQSRVQQLTEEGETVYVKFLLLPYSKVSRLVYDGDKIVPKGVVNFPVDGLPGAILFPRHHATVRFCPLFAVSATEGSRSKTFTFSELRDFLLQNDIRFTAVSFHIVYKDVIETPIGSEKVAAFAVVTSEHKNLQEAWEKHYSVDFIALSMGEIQTRLKYMLKDVYRNIWSSWNVPKPPDRF